MRNLLQQGMTPKKLAATVAVGAVVGIMPAFGFTTVVSTALAARLRLNIAATVLISYLVQPLQLLLLLPFVQLGVLLFGLGELELSIAEMQAMFRADWLNALQQLWVANLAAVSVWAMAALPTGTVLYLGLFPLFKKVLPAQQPAVVFATVAGMAPVETLGIQDDTL